MYNFLDMQPHVIKKNYQNKFWVRDLKPEVTDFGL